MSSSTRFTVSHWDQGIILTNFPVFSTVFVSFSCYVIFPDSHGCRSEFVLTFSGMCVLIGERASFGVVWYLKFFVLFSEEWGISVVNRNICNHGLKFEVSGNGDTIRV